MARSKMELLLWLLLQTTGFLRAPYQACRQSKELSSSLVFFQPCGSPVGTLLLLLSPTRTLQSLLLTTFGPNGTFQRPFLIQQIRVFCPPSFRFYTKDMVQGRRACIKWVRSHTDAQSPESVLNQKADMFAIQARQEQHPVRLNKCMNFVDNFLFRNEAGALVESDISHKVKSMFLQKVNTNAREKAIRKKANHALSFFDRHNGRIIPSFSFVLARQNWGTGDKSFVNLPLQTAYKISSDHPTPTKTEQKSLSVVIPGRLILSSLFVCTGPTCRIHLSCSVRLSCNWPRSQNRI